MEASEVKDYLQYHNEMNNSNKEFTMEASEVKDYLQYHMDFDKVTLESQNTFIASRTYFDGDEIDEPATLVKWIMKLPTKTSILETTKRDFYDSDNNVIVTFVEIKFMVLEEL